MRDLPSHLYVGPFDYEIQTWDPRSAGQAHRFGEHDPNDLVIRIDVGWKPQRVAATLVHEILHACWYVAHLPEDAKSGLESETEEGIVSALGFRISQVIRDNPEVVRWLTETLREGSF